MNKVNIILLFMSWAVTSCLGTNNSKDEIPVIDIGSNVFNMEKIYLSDYAIEIRYIPLEEDKEAMLRWNYRFYADFSDSYILESDGRNCLLYDRGGQLIRPIGGIGRGSGEFEGIDRVFLENDKIYIHDYFTDDFIEYSTDGTFVKRYKSGFTVAEKYMMEDAYLIDDSLIFGYYKNRTGKEEYKAFLFDKNGSIVESFINYVQFDLKPDARQAYSSGSPNFHKFRDIVYFKESSNDTLFMLSPENMLKPCYVFDFGKYKLPVSERGKNSLQVDINSYMDVEFISQTDKFLFVEVLFRNHFPASRINPETILLPSGSSYVSTQNRPNVLGVFDKESGNLVFSEPTDTDNPLFSSGFYNDVDAGPRFVPQSMINDSTIAMKMQFYQLLEHVESEDFKNNIPKNPEQKDKLAAMVDSLKNTGFDNPVYMLVTFRNE